MLVRLTVSDCSFAGTQAPNVWIVVLARSEVRAGDGYLGNDAYQRMGSSILLRYTLQRSIAPSVYHRMDIEGRSPISKIALGGTTTEQNIAGSVG